MKGVALWLLGASVAFLATAGAFLLLANFGSDPATGDPIPQAGPPDTGSPKPATEDPTSQTDAGGPDVRGIGYPDTGSPKPALVLNLPEDRLEDLEKEPGQRLTLEVENGSDEELPSVDLALGVASENTARPATRYYQETVEELPPGGTATVEFEVDLSSSTPAKSREVVPGADPQENREILEVKATTPEGDSDVKTVVLAP